MESLEVNGVGPVKIRRGRHLRILSVRVAPGRGVWVNVPYGVSLRQTEKFLSERREWILEQCTRMRVYEQNTGVGLALGAVINTKLHVLSILQGESSRPFYKIEGKNVSLFVPAGVPYEAVDGIARRFLLEIYKMECCRLLPDRVKSLADRFGFRYTKLSFRNNVSNWGSCSAENHISLNIKLMKLPDDLIDYVILHELCHTVEKNHSGSFWALVKKVCPDFADCRRRLKTYNTRL